MKTSNAFSFSFFFLLALSGFTGAEFIYDSDGDILNNGGAYYILPPGFGGEAIKGAAIERSPSCQLAVVAEISYDKGWAANIRTPFPVKYITNDYPLNISFANLPSNDCTKTGDWVVIDLIGSEGEPIMAGKFEELKHAVSGYFYIKPYGSTRFYKLAFCYSTASCGYVTLMKTHTTSNRLLTVSLDRSKEPLVFKFVKATSSSEKVASGISMVV
ncbi:trypsin inhibitor DE5 alpha chain-like [Neltuma alba]|uniref:trypsin inhibitor DE5 alpha chain-like n=1 Tax=Neltuma alba TaxID=207710 RepID=UPI0010A56E56|nr:trypsin inhibitor DE5 alpha chain-like [Prosopis alba]